MTMRVKISRRFFYTCVLTVTLFLILLWRMDLVPHFKSVLMNSSIHHKSNPGKRCKPPVVNPFNRDVLPYFKTPTPLDCTQEHNKNSAYRGIAFTIKNGHHLHRLADVGMPCCMQPFYMGGDINVKFSDMCHPIMGNVTKVPSNIDYIQIKCGKGGNYFYRDAFPLVHKKPHVEKRIHKYLEERKDKEALGNTYNVLILGLDATSRQNFLRKMPKSNSFIISKLSGIPLKGYNKVGLNSLPNLLPFLTGFSRVEFENKYVSPPPNTSLKLDDHPLIWKTFSETGYRTMFAEDEIMYPIFGPYGINALLRPPTDYYFTPFALHMTSFNAFGTPQDYCYGPRLSYETLLDYSKNMFETFGNDRRHFQFIWGGQISHIDLNTLSWADELLLNYLENLHNSSFLEQTAMIIFGDHGFRRAYGYADTVHGKFEDRMPLAYIVLPPSFKKSYPVAFANLMNNSERMTTAYDMHTTLADFMNLARLETVVSDAIKGHDQDDHHTKPFASTSKGISLFEPIPEERRCLEAGISLHWCLLCHPKVSLATTARIVKDATDFVITSLNELLKNYKQLCATITLKSVDEASKWDQRDVFREVCNFNGNFTNYLGTTWRSLHIACDENSSRTPHEDEVTILQLSLTVLPQNTVFEAKVARVRENEWVHVEDVVRYDEYDYNAQGLCVKGNHKIFPFCFCKNKTEIA